MYKKAIPFFIITETPLHAGSGSYLGVIDLPIQRERHTGFPKIESSSLKGSLREVFEARESLTFDNMTLSKSDLAKAISLAFGPDEGDLHAGALGFTDARILLFPVKSMKGVFAWVTCPQILEKFKNELSLAGVKGIPEIPDPNSVTHECNCLEKNDIVILEEYSFKMKRDSDKNGKTTKFAEWLSMSIMPKDKDSTDSYKFWREKMKRDVVVLENEDFRDFVELSTEVTARIKINNETGTVQKGALFYEEYLPTDSILYSLALATPVFVKSEEEKNIFRKKNGKSEEERVLDFFRIGLPPVMQIGGDATIGKGLVKISSMEV